MPRFAGVWRYRRLSGFLTDSSEVVMRIHKISIGLIILALLNLLWGCSNFQVSQDYDVSTNFSSFKTYAWQTDNQPKTGDIRVDSSLLDDRIRSAINDSFSKKGYQKIVQETPDFYVAYTYQIRSRVESNKVTVGVGIGGGSGGRFGGVGVNSGGSIREYDEGFLAIDLNDVSKKSLLWRGTGTTRVNQRTKPEENVTGINAWVEKILSQFPPLPK